MERDIDRCSDSWGLFFWKRQRRQGRWRSQHRWPKCRWQHWRERWRWRRRRSLRRGRRERRRRESRKRWSWSAGRWRYRRRCHGRRERRRANGKWWSRSVGRRCGRWCRGRCWWPIWHGRHRTLSGLSRGGAAHHGTRDHRLLRLRCRRRRASQWRWRDQIDPTAASTDSSGLALLANVTPGDLTISATLGATALRSTHVTAVAGTLVRAEVGP